MAARIISRPRSTAPATCCSTVSGRGRGGRGWEDGMQRLPIAAIMLVFPIATAHAAGDQIEPKTATWKPWVISSVREFRVAAPPNDAGTAAEILELKALAHKRDAAAQDLIAYW